MKNPYEVLGVSPSDSDDTIKQAYRALAKKYHPDNYAGSPLADLASEKMAEINAAYDQIQEMRKAASQSQQSPFSGYGYAGQSSQQSDGAFFDIRRLLSMGRVIEADELLDGTPESARNGEWYYLKARILYSRGFLEEAMSYSRRAVEMNPQNPEYQQWLSALENQRAYGYQRPGGFHTTVTTLPCINLCTTFLCCNCLYRAYCCY